MFPQIPENLEALTSSELRALATEIRTVAQSKIDGGDQLSSEEAVELQGMVTKRKEILALANSKAAAEAAAEMSEDEEGADEVAEPAEAAAEASDDADDEPAEAAAEASDDGDETDDVDTDASENTPTPTDGGDAENQQTEASVTKKVRTSMGVESRPDEDSGSGRFTPDKLLAKGGHSGRDGGAAYESWLDLADTMITVGGSLSPSSSQKIQLAYVPGNFDDEHTLSDNMVMNLRKFEPEIMAEMCAPAQPQYDLDCWNTDRRPVRNSMAAFKPDARGAVTIYPSPSLADITDQAPAGVGIWDNDRDMLVGTSSEDPKTCAVIECAEPELYRLYGVYRCLTVQNLLAMTFPELVEAYLNRLAAAHARLAETQLLEAMGTAAVGVTQPALGYGTSVSVTSTILNLLALHQEQERWDLGEMDVWLPRWIMWAMKMDIVRRRNTTGTSISVPSDSTITRMFNDVGVSPNWFIDTPSWASAVPAVQTQGALNLLPSAVEMVVAPRGKFAVMDRGELSIGVTGNNIYRDNASNSLNQFTFFFENFEALVNTNSCPAYLLTVDGLCHNGIQIDDAVIACDGSGEGS